MPCGFNEEPKTVPAPQSTAALSPAAYGRAPAGRAKRILVSVTLAVVIVALVWLALGVVLALAGGARATAIADVVGGPAGSFERNASGKWTGKDAASQAALAAAASRPLTMADYRAATLVSTRRTWKFALGAAVVVAGVAAFSAH